jgi:hypothetical protein
VNVYQNILLKHVNLKITLAATPVLRSKKLAFKFTSPKEVSTPDPEKPLHEVTGRMDGTTSS